MTDARERLLREMFSKPTVFGHISDRLTRDWTDDELELGDTARKLIPLNKRARIKIAYPLGRLDTFIRQRWPRTKVKKR